MANDAEVVLTDFGKKLMFGEDAEMRIANGFSNRNTIRHEKINEKALYYSDDNRRQIETLESYLTEENFLALQKRLKEKGMGQGFCCLFYGSPGTGKTETAYQIARKTGRDIFKVDISQIRSMWVGKSERNMKRVFDEYVMLCRRAEMNKEKTPILLFNEADGVLSRRINLDNEINPTVAQSENTIQNIILEEMERLSGIMIATTNLSTNLDSAFERRFLYRIKFDSPNVSARKSIWHDKLDYLCDDTLEELALEYDLSGGQIDNVARKAIMSEVLSGKQVGKDELLRLCKDEKEDGGNLQFSIL